MALHRRGDQMLGEDRTKRAEFALARGTVRPDLPYGAEWFAFFCVGFADAEELRIVAGQRGRAGMCAHVDGMTEPADLTDRVFACDE
jgi:hypothetical protein